MIYTKWNLKNQSSHKKCEHLNLQIYVSRYLSFKIICKGPLIDWNLKDLYHAKPKICKIVVFTYTLIHFRYNHQSQNRNGRNWKKLKTKHSTVSNISFATFSNVSHLLLLAIIVCFFLKLLLLASFQQLLLLAKWVIVLLI